MRGGKGLYEPLWTCASRAPLKLAVAPPSLAQALAIAPSLGSSEHGAFLGVASADLARDALRPRRARSLLDWLMVPRVGGFGWS